MAAGRESLSHRWIRGVGLLYLCIRGPRLYRVYRLNHGRGRAREENESEPSWVRGRGIVLGGRGISMYVSVNILHIFP